MKTTINDLSGGITDYINSANQNESEICKNFNITKDAKLISRNGSILFDTNNPRVSSSSKPINKLIYFQDRQLSQQYKSLYYHSGSSYETITTISGSQVFASATTPKISMAIMNDHIYMTSDQGDQLKKMWWNGSGYTCVRSGLPTPTLPSITGSGGSACTYLYRFVYVYDYTIGDVTYQDVSVTTQSNIIYSAAIGSAQIVVIGSMTAVASGQNYDQTNIKMDIYRTINAGTNFFKVTSLSASAMGSGYLDSMPDATLINQELLYTEGDIVENEQPPICKYVESTGGYLYYGNVKQGSVSIPYRLQQSTTLDGDSAPADFYIDMDEEITGLSSVDIYPIVITDKKVYRIENVFDDLGRGGMTRKIIYDKDGCINNNSIVKTQNGLYFAGKYGFYFTDGFNVISISDKKFRKTYDNLVSTTAKKDSISGCYSPTENKIYWTCAIKGDEPDSIMVYDEIYKGFTIHTNIDFYPTALFFSNENMIRGHRYGYIFIHDSEYYSDPEPSIQPYTQWLKQYLPYEYKHIKFDFGNPDTKKWFSNITIEFQRESVTQTAISTYDDGKLKECKPVRIVNNLVWGDEQWVWRDSIKIWNDKANAIIKRKPHHGSIRCGVKQLHLKNNYAIIQKSDDYETATINMLTQTATIGSSLFVNDAKGYYFRFKPVGSSTYSSDLLIISRDSDSQITFTSPQGSSTFVNAEWEIVGYDKRDRIHINSFSYDYTPIENVETHYNAGDGGGND